MPRIRPSRISLVGPIVAFFLVTSSTIAATRQESSLLTEPLEVSRVVDGDTIYVMRGGKQEKLRLLSVDTEEKITGRAPLSPTKPETVYGQECADWAKAFFADLGEDGKPARVRLLFPGDREESDIYGRLLCHVVLMDGRDFNLLLVQEGMSPYFNKYGNSRLKHEEFVAAQAEAQRKELGVWNPRTNMPRTEGAPVARRPYERLLPWWQARAEAIEAFRGQGGSGEWIAADAPDDLQGWFESSPGTEIRVFGEIYRLHDERDGTLTAEFRSTDKKRAFRAVVPARNRKEIEPLLRASTEEFRQNFLVVSGLLEKGPRGLQIVAPDTEQWELAGPEPRSIVEATHSQEGR